MQNEALRHLEWVRLAICSRSLTVDGHELMFRLALRHLGKWPRRSSTSLGEWFRTEQTCCNNKFCVNLWPTLRYHSSGNKKAHAHRTGFISHFESAN